MYFRSDMAKELQKRAVKEYSKEHTGEPDGIRCTEQGRICTVEIFNENGARLLGKPEGKYVTVNVGKIWETDADKFRECADLIADTVKSMAKPDGCVLAVGLGNRDVTADALGPLAASHIIATHHIKDTAALDKSGLGDCAALFPGVLSQTGIEAYKQIKAAAESVEPRLIIIIDSLAAAGVETLSTSVQITDTGISPGSGVGNDRGELSEKTLGVPVIAVGVPTIIDAAALLPDGSDNEYRRLKGCYVCPKDSDRSVKELARLIGYAVNRICHPFLSYEDMAYI